MKRGGRGEAEELANKKVDWLVGIVWGLHFLQKLRLFPRQLMICVLLPGRKAVSTKKERT